MTKKFSAFVILLMAFTFSMAASGARIQQDEPASAPESYIRDVKLIGGSSSEVSSLKAKARKEGWTVIESDLNAGTSLISDYRIRYAQELMRKRPDMPHADVAEAAGFSSRTAFLRTFKAQTGLTPSEWKRQEGLGNVF